MSTFNFIVMFLAGIAALLVSWGKLPIKPAWRKQLTPSTLKLLHFAGWTLILFSLYDRYITFVLSQT